MPVIYKTRERRRLYAVDLEKLKNKLIKLGYEFIREGGFRPEDKPFKFSNYLFYQHPKTNKAFRIGYNYPLIGNKNTIFEICYAHKRDEWWTYIIPDYRKPFWKDVIMDNIPNHLEWRKKYRNKNE